jgi:hypothetical protein
MSRSPHAGRWLLAIAITLVITAAGVWMYQAFGFGLPQLDLPQWVAISAAVVILAGKMMLKGLLGKEFKLYEQGPETSLMAVGAAVPTAADSFVRTHHESLMWCLFAFAAIIVFIFAALSSQAAEDSTTSTPRSLWSAASMILGAGSFLFYMFLVVLKTGG